MKKLFSVLVAILLVLGMMPVTALAAGTVTGLVNNAAIAVPVGTNQQLTSANRTISFAIPGTILDTAANFAVGDNLLTSGVAIAFEQPADYQGSYVFNQLFAAQSLTVAAVDNPATGVPTQLTLSLSVGAAHPFNYDTGYKFRLKFTHGATGTQTFDLTPSLTAKDGSVSALKNYSPLEQEIFAGESYTIPLSNYVDLRNGGSLTTGVIGTYGLGVSQTDQQGNFTVSLNGTNIKVEAANSASTGSYTINAKVTGKTATNEAGTEQLIQIPVKIKAPVVQDATLDGVQAGQAFSWTLPASNNILPGNNGAFTITFTQDNFVWSNNQNRDLRNFEAAIKGYFNMTHSTYFETPQWNITQTQARVTLTPKTEGVLNGFTVNLQQGAVRSEVKTVNLTIETPVVDAVLEGVANNTSLTGSIPDTMKPGDSFAITMGIGNFRWSNNQNRKFDAAKLNQIKAWANSLPDASHFTADWSFNDTTVTLKLTATANLGTRAINFRLYDGQQATIALSKTVNVQNPATITGNKIIDIHSSSYLGQNVVLDGKALTGDPGDLEVSPGNVMYLDFDSGFFEWENGQPNPAANVTTSMLSRGKIAVKASKRTGSDVIEDVSIVSEGGKARVKITFAENLNSLKEKKFSATVYFTVNGKRHTDSQLEIAGTISNESQEAWDGETYYDMEYAPILEVNDNIRNAELYVGNGITILTNLQRNRKYYAATSNEYTSTDEERMLRYDSIVDAIHLSTNNIPTTAKVSFDTDEKLYVYDEDGKYLGTTSDKLGLSSVYYLSTKRISMNIGGGTSVIEDPDVPAPSGPPTNADNSTSGGAGGTGGSAGSSSGSGSNGGYNPPTGAVPKPIAVGVSALMRAAAFANR